MLLFYCSVTSFWKYRLYLFESGIFQFQKKLSWYQIWTSTIFTSSLFDFPSLNVHNYRRKAEGSFLWIHNVTFWRFVFGQTLPWFYDRFPFSGEGQSAIVVAGAPCRILSHWPSLLPHIPYFGGPVLQRGLPSVNKQRLVKVDGLFHEPETSKHLHPCCILKFSQRLLWRSLSFGIWHHAVH
jgi:hypothetical protein